MSLFRPEVAAAQTAHWLGSVRLHRPLSFSLVTGSALALAAALIAFVTWGEVNRKAHLSGLLVPTLGTLNITTPQPGTVVQLPVAEGQTVQAGEVLLVLNAERSTLRNGVADDTSERIAQQIATRAQSLQTERTLRELQAGQSVQAGQNLLTLLPLGTPNSAGQNKAPSLQAHLYAPSRTAGFVRPGRSLVVDDEIVANQRLRCGWA